MILKVTDVKKGYCMQDNHDFELYTPLVSIALWVETICTCLFHYLVGMLEVVEPKFLKPDKYLK